MLLAAAWTLLPGSPIAWTLAVLAVAGFPIVRVLLTVPRFKRSVPLRVHWTLVKEDLVTAVAQTVISVTFLIYHAFQMLHAIAVTLVRLLYTQRRLLEWVPAARLARSLSRYGLSQYWLEMAVSPLTAVALTLTINFAMRKFVVFKG